MTIEKRLKIEMIEQAIAFAIRNSDKAVRRKLQSELDKIKNVG